MEARWMLAVLLFLLSWGARAGEDADAEGGKVNAAPVIARRM